MTWRTTDPGAAHPLAPAPADIGAAARRAALAAWVPAASAASAAPEASAVSAAPAASAASAASAALAAPSATPPARDEPDQRRDRDARLSSLLAAAAAGDSAAFEAFYEATFAYARTVARRLLRDNAEIEDLLADCYFEAWRSATRFDPARGSPVTWLLTLVRSRGVDALRAAAARPDRPEHPDRTGAEADRGPRERTVGAEGALSGAPSAASELCTHTDPADELWRRQSGAALHAALADLSAPERWVLGLAYLRELSHAEISQCTGMPLGTVKSHALRGQHKLRALLAGVPARTAPAAGTSGRDGTAGAPHAEP